MQAVTEVDCRGDEPLPREVHTSPVPVLLRGYVSHWPAVAGCSTASAAADYLGPFSSDRRLTVYAGGEEIRGRFSYNEDFTGFNFKSGTATLKEVLTRLDDPHREDGLDSIYVGSTPIDQWLPGFRRKNDVELPVSDALASFWLGNRTTVSAHFDFPDNLACVVSGKRRFTLFPPEQLENLYVGPLDHTPSGQAISLVDFERPDFDRFPAFRKALEHALLAALEPGDALFIPGMWWHHVRALENFNLLVNYWWCTSPAWMGAPSAALNHALFALRGLPERQRKAWKNLFDHYVFDVQEHSLDHIPESGKGILGPLDESMSRQIRADLINRLKG